MPADPLKLQALTLVAVQDATNRYLSDGNIDSWERDMRRAIVKGHTAAAIAGVAERSFGGRVREFFSKFVGDRALGTEDRSQLKARIKDQLDYLDGFVADVRAGTLSPEAISARAALYSGAVRGSYSASRYSNVNLPFHPTEGSECMSNCRCSWELVDVGDGEVDAYWRMGATEQHCATCPSRASGSPYRVGRKG